MHAALRNTRFWFGLLVSIAAVWFAVRGVAWSDVVAELRGADYIWLVPAGLMVLAGQVGRAARWQVLFGDRPRPSLSDSFAILSIGYLVSTVFPLRLGDPIRAWLVDTRTPARGSEAFGTIMVERAIDLLTVLALVAVIVPEPGARFLEGHLGPGPWSAPGRLGVIAAAVVALVYAAMMAVSWLGGRAGRLVAGGLEAVGVSMGAARAVGTAVAGFAVGLGTLRQPRTAALTVGWSLAIWLIGGLETWFALWAFHLDLPFAAAVFVLCGTAIFAILPSSPGYVGVFHSAAIVTLALFAAVPKDVALSFAIVLHAVVTVVLIALGALGLKMLDLAPGMLSRRLESVPEA